MVIDKSFSKNESLKYLAAIILFILHETCLGGISIFTIGRTSYFFLFFVVGRLLRKYHDTIEERIKKYGLHMASLLFALYISTLILDYSIPVKGLSWIIKDLIIPLSACGFLWIVAVWMGQNRFWSYFGQYSLQYYLNHMLVLLGSFYIGKAVFHLTASYLLTLLCVFLLTLSMSYFMLIIENKMKKVKFLFGL